MANERLDRFVKLLKEIFELDKSDLDFGIYRVMNLRKTQIETFLADRLPEMVQDTLAPFAQGSKEKIHNQMTQIEENAAGMGMTVDALPDTAPLKQKYIALQKQLAEGTDLAALETDVYSALYSFFNRYYEEGDFISKRRYKEGVYAIPYEGEEVKLYWANQDQYYIKTSENFKDYTFVSDGITVHFRLVDATTEQNNNKESKDSKRVFMLFTEDEETYPGIKTFEYDVDAAEVIIRFVYDIPEDKKKKYTEENYAAITKWLLSLRRAELNPLIAPITTSKGKETTTLLEKHLKGYVAKNTFDYFIHKDLRGFLTRELDFFIKSEVMHLDDLDTSNEVRVETYLAKVKAIKRVGKIVIDFLAQIEDFQKKLWLKKKFIVETNWCITLDKIDESFWSEIIANKEQIDEWISMYAIDEADGWSNPPTVEFLRQNQNLIVDTKHFSSTFKDELLESISDLDENTNGVMVNSDNYHALSFLQTRYKEMVDVVYIDPPYNTDASEILYKNNYKHSSFLTMMENRLGKAYDLLSESSMIAVAIDDAELDRLIPLMNGIFPKSAGITVVRSNPQSRKAKGKFSPQHEYCLYYAKSENTAPRSLGFSESKLKRYPLQDEIGHYSWMNFIRAGNNDLRTDRPKLYYPIAVAQDDTIRVLNMDWNEEKQEYVLLERPKEGEILVFPIKFQNGLKIEKNWQRGHERVKKEIPLGEYRVRRTPEGIAIDFKTRMDEEAMPTTWWDKNEYASANYAPTELKELFGDKPFDFAKARSLVQDALCACGGNNSAACILDFFAGSATTGDAVIQLNRIDNGSRKWILVEMGEYFNLITKPRMQKVCYSSDWKDGKPQQRNSGVSQIIKYMSLESYEDALSNIELSDDTNQFASLLGEDYLIHYMVDFESRGSLLDVEAFSNPFAYTMKITEKNECKERSIDLCETFNYLIGLTVSRQGAISYYFSKPAENPAYEGAVDLVGDISGQYAFRQIEGTLPDGRRALIIWRTVTDDIIASNAALDAYFTTYRKGAQDCSYDVIFVNGDNNLENLRRSNEAWKVQITEIEFKKRMFEEV